MGKVLVALVVPAVGEKYDLFIPDFLTVGECTELLANAVMDMTNKQYVRSGKEVLLYRGSAGCAILNKKYTIADYGLKNGELLYIF